MRINICFDVFQIMSKKVITINRGVMLQKIILFSFHFNASILRSLIPIDINIYIAVDSDGS